MVENTASNAKKIISSENVKNKEYFQGVQDLTICLYCNNILMDPIECNKCESNYCRECIYSINSDNSICPKKCYFPKFSNSSKYVKDLLLKIEFSCICFRNIPYLEYLSHISKCTGKRCFSCSTIIKLNSFNLETVDLRIELEGYKKLNNNLLNELKELRSKTKPEIEKFDKIENVENFEILEKSEVNPQINNQMQKEIIDLNLKLKCIVKEKDNEIAHLIEEILYLKLNESEAAKTKDHSIIDTKSNMGPYQKPIIEHSNFDNMLDNQIINNSIIQTANYFQSDQNSIPIFLENSPVEIKKFIISGPEMKYFSLCKSTVKEEFETSNPSFFIKIKPVVSICSHYERNYRVVLGCCTYQIHNCINDHDDSQHVRSKKNIVVCNHCQKLNRRDSVSCIGCNHQFFSRNIAKNINKSNK